MKNKSVLDEAQQLSLAIRLIKLGARLQLLESETSLSRERLTRLYIEIIGSSPPKGMLPFSADWFLPWAANIHSSLFFNIRTYLVNNTSLREVEILATAYQLYLESAQSIEALTNRKSDGKPYLSLMRAWTLSRFLESGLLGAKSCSKCQGNYVVNSYDLNQFYVCNLCQIPSRAGKLKKINNQLAIF